MRLLVSAAAHRDLDSIYDYWAERASMDIAGELIRAIADRFLLLAESPNIGRRCDDIATRVLRFPIGDYLIYYRKARGAIQILHVFHGARDQRTAFRQG